jgi:hypothetical protein
MNIVLKKNILEVVFLSSQQCHNHLIEYNLSIMNTLGLGMTIAVLSLD